MKLPNLPEGMHYEDRKDGVYIVWPKHGSVSVDLKRRCFTLGFTSGNFVDLQPDNYIGAGWKDRLIADAVAALKAPWEKSE